MPSLGGLSFWCPSLKEGVQSHLLHLKESMRMSPASTEQSLAIKGGSVKAGSPRALQPEGKCSLPPLSPRHLFSMLHQHREALEEIPNAYQVLPEKTEYEHLCLTETGGFGKN